MLPGDLLISSKEPQWVCSQRTIPEGPAELPNKLSPLTPADLGLAVPLPGFSSRVRRRGGGKAVYPGTEDSLWLVIHLTIMNLIIMSGHAKKLLQEVLRHELGVTATPWTAVSKGQSKAVFSVKDQLLCAGHEMTALTGTVPAKLLTN